MVWQIYLSGEIHTDWREKIEQGIKQADLAVILSSPNTNHASSDDCGDMILDKEEHPGQLIGYRLSFLSPCCNWCPVVSD